VGELDSGVSSSDGLFLFFLMLGGEEVMFVVLSVKVCVGRTMVVVCSAACRLEIPRAGGPAVDKLSRALSFTNATYLYT
jgi:hypothetical protein